MSRVFNVSLNALSVILVAAGVLVVASIFVPQLPKFLIPSPTLEAGSSEMSQVPGTTETPESTENAEDGADADPAAVDQADPAAVAPDSPETSGSSETAGASEALEGPEDKTLTVSIPEMSRVEGNSVPNAVGDNEGALRQNVAIHLKGTGYPWQDEANVYLAGHRIGFPGTESFLGFYDLNKLEKGDEIQVTDAEGGDYTYRVYRQEVVRPTNTTITEPVDGRNILTLQTCTLPDYTQRLVVQAEKIA